MLPLLGIMACNADRKLKRTEMLLFHRSVFIDFYTVLVLLDITGYSTWVLVQTLQQTGIPFREAWGVERHLPIVGYFA